MSLEQRNLGWMLREECLQGKPRGKHVIEQKHDKICLLYLTRFSSDFIGNLCFFTILNNAAGR